jgi:hypothetical protein
MKILTENKNLAKLKTSASSINEKNKHFVKNTHKFNTSNVNMTHQNTGMSRENIRSQQFSDRGRISNNTMPANIRPSSSNK